MEGIRIPMPFMENPRSLSYNEKLWGCSCPSSNARYVPVQLSNSEITVLRGKIRARARERLHTVEISLPVRTDETRRMKREEGESERRTIDGVVAVKLHAYIPENLISGRNTGGAAPYSLSRLYSV